MKERTRINVTIPKELKNFIEKQASELGIKPSTYAASCLTVYCKSQGFEPSSEKY